MAKKVFLTPNGMFQVDSKKEILEFMKERYPSVKVKEIVEVVGELPPAEKLIVLRDLLNKESKLRDVKYHVDLCMGGREPTRTFKIGESVIYGNHKNMFVTDIHDDGKFYTVYNGVDERYPIWTELKKARTYEQNDLIPLFKEQKSFSLNYSQASIDSLFTFLYSFGVNMNPPYQRDLVWSDADKELLIDSVFKDLDIGKFVFVHNGYEKDGPGYDILDGKQRLSTLRDFYEDLITYKGFKFSELNFGDQSMFLGKSISYAKIDGSRLTEKDIVNYFLRLNQGGVSVDKEHLKAISEKYGI